MRIRRKVVVGYWKVCGNPNVRFPFGCVYVQLGQMHRTWLIIRFGDQMNNVAVTDGDKVEAEVRMGYHVDYCPVSELMEYHSQVKDEDVKSIGG